MRVYHTNVPDVTKENIPESKMILAENIIRNVYPLFDEVLSSKLDEVKNLELELKTKRKQVLEKRDHLEKLMSGYRRKKKEAKLLSRVHKLVNSGLAYDGTLKNEITILMRVVDKLSEEKLDHHLKRTLAIIHKRFRT